VLGWSLSWSRHWGSFGPGTWLEVNIDIYHSCINVNRSFLGPFSGSCASALPCAPSDSFCSFRFDPGQSLCLSGFSRVLPETLRAIVGDGSISAGWVYTHPISFIGRHCSSGNSNERPPRKPFKNPLLMFAYPEIIILLIFNGTLYAVMYGVTASLSVIFEKVYPYLNQTVIGLCFLATGLGMLVGSLLSGRVLDSSYRKIRDDLIHQSRIDSEKHTDAKDIERDPSFPIEKARLQILPWVVIVYTTCVIGYGWALQARVTIAVPLIMQFISKLFSPHDAFMVFCLITFHLVGITAVIVMNATQTLLVDMMPNQGSSITACVRLLLSASQSHGSH
jgi:hypothetical protein